jgi:hypothetical protein
MSKMVKTLSNTTREILLDEKKRLLREKEEIRADLKTLDFGEGLLGNGNCTYPFPTDTFTGLCDHAKWRADVLKKCVTKTIAKKVLRRVKTLNKKIVEYKKKVASFQEQAAKAV